MNPSLRMLLVLGGIALVSGTALGALHQATWERAENNVLRFKKIPAVVAIRETFSGPLDAETRAALEEELLAEKRTATLADGSSMLFFVVNREGVPYAAAIENYGQGFGGKLGVMVGIELDTGNLVGMGVTTMSETPGIGTRVHEEGFAGQFAGMSRETIFKVKKDGGDLDAITGATISSRAVAQAVEAAVAVWNENADVIREVSTVPPSTTPPATPGGVS